MASNDSWPGNHTDDAGGGEQELSLSLDPTYAALEGVVAVAALLGNGVVLVAFARERRLRRRTNYYIASLAVADLLVGLLGVPCALLAAVGEPRNLRACLSTLSLLLALCTSSILSLVAVSLDRYWAILHPLVYSRHMRTRTSLSIICACWAAGLVVGLLPVLGWHKGGRQDARCVFDEIMDHGYLVFVYFATIVAPVLLLAFFYAHIYQVVRKQQVRQAALSAAQQQQRRQQQRDVRTAQQLAVIVAFFALCWLPLYTLNCVQAFRPLWRPPSAALNACIVLSHLNSAGNPLLYAYHLRDFRAAFRSLLLPAGACQQAAPRLSPLGAAVRRARTLASAVAAPAAPHAATATAAASAAFTACAAPGPGAASHLLLRHLRCSPQKLRPPLRRPTEIVAITLAAPNGRSTQRHASPIEPCRGGRQAC